MSDGKYVDANEAFLHLMGFERDEVIGRTSLELKFWTDPGVRQEMVAELREHSSFRGMQTRYVRKNGEIIWILVSATAIEIEGVPCILSVVQDISEAKNAEQRLAKAREALRASEQLLNWASGPIPLTATRWSKSFAGMVHATALKLRIIPRTEPCAGHCCR
jgi:PAS domain S-box-containing protein